MGEELYIKGENVVLDDVAQIETIVSNIQTAFEDLGDRLNQLIGGDLKVQWAEELLEHWNEYKGNAIPDTLDSMKASAKNLELAVREAKAYSEERQ